MCTNQLPFNGEDEIKNKTTPVLPHEFKDMNNVLAGMLEKTAVNRLDIYQIENMFGKESSQFNNYTNKETEVKKIVIVVSSKNIFEG